VEDAMIDPDSLNIWNDQRLVGYLWRNSQGLMGFRYDSTWLAQGGFAISHTLPLREEDFNPEQSLAHRFFANLLPEGNVREQVVRDLKIANTDFDLLRAIGGECAGALSILQAEQVPSKEYEYYKIPDDDLANLVARKGRIQTWTANERPRLSLAGAQDKCPVLVDNDTYFLPKQESPSSHILKFELSGYRHLPAYETFTTHLAAAIGLPVVNIHLRSVAQTHYALIERYDRRKDKNGRMEKFHQEDFCQALGFGHERKYQEHGGPSFADCYRLIQDVSSDPANDLLHLLRWQIFNVLAGNSDGHAKNLSLLYQPNGEIRLAPFYDLVCTRAIERIDHRLAFSVGDERDPGIILSQHWAQLAQQCGIRPRFLHQQVQNIADKLLQQLQSTQETFTNEYGNYPALQRIELYVAKQCRKAISDKTEV
jgi:serine/threonine-protein kinase HipA